MKESSARQSARQQSRVDNRGASYSNVRDVYNAPVTHQTIVKDNSVTYEVDHEDVQGLERFSMWVMENIGEKNAKLTALITILLGGGGLTSFTSWSARLPNLGTAIFVVCVALVFVGVAMVAALQYKANSRCTKCNRFYAMREFGTPVVKESPRKGGVQRTTKRHYRCRFCGDEVTETDNEFIEDEPEDSS